jgi:EAL domain-containing protein (putative c-di-GMP-specific phosphodiesterase class I)
LRADTALENQPAGTQKKRRERIDPPRTALEVASLAPRENGAQHRARFMPPPTDLAVSDASPKPVDEPVFGETFEAMLEPIVAIPAGTIAGYRVLAGFPQPDGRFHPVSELPEGAWGERASTFGDRLFARTASIATRHFEAAGDVKLYVPVPASMLSDSSSVRALRQRFADNPGLSRSLVPVIGTRTLDGLKNGATSELAAIRKSGTEIALQVEDENPDVAKSLARLGAGVVFAPADVFPVASQPGWLDPVQTQTKALVIATGIRAENSVIAMMDRNVGYMSGPLFAEPKRLKDDADGIHTA